jgi:hypothetical protein
MWVQAAALGSHTSYRGLLSINRPERDLVISVLHCIASDGRIIDKLERIWKDAVVA